MSFWGDTGKHILERVEEVNKLYHTSATQLDNISKNVQLLREEIHSLRDSSSDHGSRIATLEAQFKNAETVARERHDTLLKSVEERQNTTDAKLQAVKA